MNDGYVRPIRDFDGNGRLIAAGVEWTEILRVPIWILAALYVLIGIPTGVAFIIAIGSGLAMKPTALFLCGVVMLIGISRYGLQFCSRQRSLVFHRDGWINTPGGLPWIGGGGIERLSFSHDTVSTIEKRLAEKLCGQLPLFFIEVRSREGDWITVGHLVDEQISHKAVVQLTKALAEIREATARPEDRFTAKDALEAARAAMAGAKRGDTVNVIID